MQGNYFMPTRVVMGKDVIESNSQLLKYGKCALIVTGKTSSKKIKGFILHNIDNYFGFSIWMESLGS